MVTWEVAPDIGKRLKEHRTQVLGLSQEEYGRLFGRSWKQVSAWENEHSAPPATVLERAASDNGWPLAIFAKAGPMPATLPVSPATGRTPPTYTWDQAIAILEAELGVSRARNQPIPREKQREILAILRSARDATSRGGDAAGDSRGRSPGRSAP